MLYAPPFPFEQGPSMYPASPINPIGFDGYNNDIFPFLPSNVLLPGALPGYPGRSMSVNYGQRQYYTPMQNVLTGPPSQFLPTSTLSYDAAPFQPQQTISPHSTERETLQFIPSQVLRNIPKKP